MNFQFLGLFWNSCINELHNRYKNSKAKKDRDIAFKLLCIKPDKRDETLKWYLEDRRKECRQFYKTKNELGIDLNDILAEKSKESKSTKKVAKTNEPPAKLKKGASSKGSINLFIEKKNSPKKINKASLFHSSATSNFENMINKIKTSYKWGFSKILTSKKKIVELIMKTINVPITVKKKIVK